MDDKHKVKSDYIIHKGLVDGHNAIALLWVGSGWPYGEDATVRITPEKSGTHSAVIESNDQSLELLGIDPQLAGHIERDGMYVIYQERSGESRHVKLMYKAD